MRSLRAALERLENSFSEKQLALTWLEQIKNEGDVWDRGWYSPPPKGLSVLIGNEPDYGRLNYESLRNEENWPKNDVLIQPESIVYPYFSAVDKKTGMIGDHVGTYYAGKNKEIVEWIRLVYRTTLAIAESAQIGMKFSEVFAVGQERLVSVGGSNNTFSMSGGLAADIGHSVPFFEDGERIDLSRDVNLNALYSDISSGRNFVSASSSKTIEEDVAFTVEPQILANGLPMVSYHFIVVFSGGQKIIVSEYDDIFEWFGMSL